METWALRQIREQTLRRDSFLDDVLFTDPRPSAIGARQTGEHFHGRALARAVRADEQRDLTGAGRKGQAAQHRIASVVLDDAFDNDTSFAVGKNSASRRALRAQLPELRSQRRAILDEIRARQRRAFVRKSQKLQGRTIGKKCDRWKIAPQDAKQIEFAMRQVVDPVAIQIEREFVVPQISDTVHRPAGAGNVGAAGFDGMQVVRENIFRELVVVRVRTEAQTDVILHDAIADDFVRVALIEREADRIFGDLIPFQRAAVGRLKNESVSAMAAVIDEAIAAHYQSLREHDGGAGRVFGKRVVLESIAVRIHVVQAVADVMDEIVFDPRIVRERKINAIARVADLVAADHVSFAVPLVNAVAAPIGNERGVAILAAAANCFLHRLICRGQRRLALNAVVENLGTRAFFQVDAVE